mgnify:CR=1 FL=1
MKSKGKSNTKLKKQLMRKTNSTLVETINNAREHKGWKEVVDILTGPTRKYSVMNLFDIDKKTTAGDTVIVLGKVLSKGELTKKVRICALSFSEKTTEKLKKTKSEGVTILQEIKINSKAEGIKILR